MVLLWLAACMTGSIDISDTDAAQPCPGGAVEVPEDALLVEWDPEAAPQASNFFVVHGEGQICGATCTQEWLAVGRPFPHEWPVLVDGTADMMLRMTAPADAEQGACTLVTSGGDWTIEVSVL